MKSRFPNHAAMLSLLAKKQFEPCRMLVEERIEELMAGPEQEETDERPSSNAFEIWQERDRELAHLHVILCRVLHGLDRYEEAALIAETAAFLARKIRENDLQAESLHLAGICYSQAGNYGAAIERLSGCLLHASGLLLAKALYNRGHVYSRQCSYAWAVADYDEALKAVSDQDAHLARACRINLAWTLIMIQEFERAEETLVHLSNEQGAEADHLLQLQIAHDRVHIAYLKGQNRDALRQALAALRQSGRQYPHVQARIALTLMSLSADLKQPEQAFAMGIFAKRLAGKARRPDLDEEAGKRMHKLDIQAGTEYLVPPLLRIGELTKGSLRGRYNVRRDHKAGGVG